MLDTQILSWLAGDRGKLNQDERAAIERHADTLIVSVISIWEMRLKWRVSPRKAEKGAFMKPGEAVNFCSRRSIDIVAFTADVATQVLDPPLRHRDPFDEILMVHADRLGARLLTRDDDLLGHPLAFRHP